MKTIGILVIAAAMIAAAGAVGAVEAPAPPACAPNCPAGVPSDDPAVQANMPGCAVWTDRCVTCQREDGEIACSNIGIACQPQALQCLRPEPATQEKKSGN